MATRKSRMIEDQKDIDYLINLTEEDITLSLVMKTFGEFDGKRKFHPYDLFIVPKGSYGIEGKKNKEDFLTGVGIWIFNKYMIEKELFNVFEYINENITSKTLDGMNKKMSYYLTEDKITIQQHKQYLMKTQKLMPYVSILSPNQTEKMMTCDRVIEKKKNELIKKYKSDIESGNELIADEIEKELIAYAMEYLKDDPSLDGYLSGARGSIGNNFKNMYIMKGAVRNPDPNAKKMYDIATSCYKGGISKKEYALFANALSAGPYSRANKTMVGGYWEKLFMYAYQHLVLAEEGSDCGTKGFITVKLTKSNIDGWMYSYIIEGDKLIEITSDNMGSYIGKTVKMRFASMCKLDGKFCNKCFGNMFYRVKRKNVGTATTVIPSKLKNISMKNFHDSSMKFTEMDPMKAFGLK